MLKTFRRMFARTTPVEFEVARREDPAGDGTDAPTETEDAGTQAMAPDVLAAVSEVRSDLAHQRTAQEQLAGTLEGLEPLGRQMTQRLEAIATTERHVEELVGSFMTSAEQRDAGMREAMSTLNTSAERQVHVLGMLHEQLDGTTTMMQTITEQVQVAGGNIESLREAQQATSERTSELVEAVRAQTEANARQQRWFFGLAIGVLLAAAAALIVAIVLAT